VAVVHGFQVRAEGFGSDAWVLLFLLFHTSLAS
jgi:hypothetical protein